ncbi:hypothetical protein H0H92_007454 [Tricholoma furcatifolium]|nr:hypothetical protein H0H92_007454 [Tricholoma furcatifolium]
MASVRSGSRPEQLLRQPFGLKWRSSYLFTTITVTVGITTDLLVYTIIVPVMPFHLEQLGYNDVSALTGWLLFAFSELGGSKSAGLVLANIPIAVFSERYGTRKWPLIIGLLVFSGSQVMLMEAPTYAVMCIARFIQGVSSAVIWVVGLALICDATPSALIGTHLGIAMSGPPVGGALFARFGYRAPFILSIGWTIIDLIARLLIIERKDALKWGVDPHDRKIKLDEKMDSQDTPDVPPPAHAPEDRDMETLDTSSSRPNVTSESQKLSLLAVLLKLCKSSRALTAFFLTFAYGYGLNMRQVNESPDQPCCTDVWALDSAKVGLVFLASGAEWITFTCIVLAVPWILVMIIRGPLALFIVAFALEMFFASGVISPITAELARVAEGIDGVGYAHTYAVFNIAYGVGSAGQ